MAEVYTVQHGDTLFSLSKKTGVILEKIRAANDLQSILSLPNRCCSCPKNIKSVIHFHKQRFEIDLWELKSHNRLYSITYLLDKPYVPKRALISGSLFAKEIRF